MRVTISFISQEDLTTQIKWSTCDCNEACAKKIQLLLNDREVKSKDKEVLGKMKVEIERIEEPHA